MIGLAKGAVGPELKYRMKIVQTLGEKEHPEIDLPEDACDSIFEHKDGVVVRTDFLEDDENPLLEYLTREKKEAREEHLTKMTKEIFQRLWSQVIVARLIVICFFFFLLMTCCLAFEIGSTSRGQD